jgi:hypothetical protein
MYRFALRLLAMLTFAALTAPAALAADATAPAGSESMGANAVRAPLSSFDIVYVETDLREPGLASAGPDPDFVDWKILDVARLIQERAPKVLAANGLTGIGVVVPAPTAGAALEMASTAPDRPVLLLRIAAITKSKPRLFTTAGDVAFDVQLLDRAEGAAAPIWRERLAGRLGFDPVFGVLKTNRVDSAWVDSILVLALDRLAQRGMVNLPTSKAAKP